MKSKITDLRVEIFEAPFLSQLLVKICHEEDEVGIGECWWGVDDPSVVNMDGTPVKHLMPIVSTLEHLIKPRVVGEYAHRIGSIRQKLIQYAYRYGCDGIFMCALSGVDLALWDLLGKRLGVPVADLFGGTVKDGVRAYASLPPLKTRELIQREVSRALDAGFLGVKLHESEPETARWARDVTGPEIAIMFDAMGAFTPANAVETGKQLRLYDTYWFEEPVWPMRDQASLSRVRSESGIRIAAGENEFDLERFYLMMSNGTVDFVMPEITKVGGLTVARQLSVIAEMFNRPLSPHGFRVGPALYANIHWALTSPTSDWLEIPFLPEGYEFPANVRCPILKDGKITLPSGLGLGVEYGKGISEATQ